jgi:uncharacterized protein (TIGR02284 family)
VSTVISQVRDEINKLVETCHDGEAGFRAASEAITNPAIKAEMMQYSRQRAEFVTELEKAVAELGESPASEGSVAGALHRGWIHLIKSVGSSDHAVLSSCERGEDSAVAAYRAALNAALPGKAGALVASQFQAVRRTHDRIKLLRDANEKN